MIPDPASTLTRFNRNSDGRLLIPLTHEDVVECVELGIAHHEGATLAGGTNHPIGHRDPYDHHIEGKGGERAHSIMTGLPMRRRNTADAGWDVEVMGWLIDIKTRDWQGEDIVFMVPQRQLIKHGRTDGFGFFRRVGHTELRVLAERGEGATFEWFGYISRSKLVHILGLLTSTYGEACYTCEARDLAEQITAPPLGSP